MHACFTPLTNVSNLAHACVNACAAFAYLLVLDGTRQSLLAMLNEHWQQHYSSYKLLQSNLMLFSNSC